MTTIKPPYYSVIFTSTKAANVSSDYTDTLQALLDHLPQQPGFLGMDSMTDESQGLTVCYWRNLDDIQAWKQNSTHLFAQQQGQEKWYETYQVKIAKVERSYHFPQQQETL